MWICESAKIPTAQAVRPMRGEELDVVDTSTVKDCFAQELRRVHHLTTGHPCGCPAPPEIPKSTTALATDQ